MIKSFNVFGIFRPFHDSEDPIKFNFLQGQNTGIPVYFFRYTDTGIFSYRTSLMSRRHMFDFCRIYSQLVPLVEFSNLRWTQLTQLRFHDQKPSVMWYCLWLHPKSELVPYFVILYPSSALLNHRSLIWWENSLDDWNERSSPSKKKY